MAQVTTEMANMAKEWGSPHPSKGNNQEQDDTIWHDALASEQAAINTLSKGFEESQGAERQPTRKEPKPSIEDIKGKKKLVESPKMG